MNFCVPVTRRIWQLIVNLQKSFLLTLEKLGLYILPLGVMNYNEKCHNSNIILINKVHDRFAHARACIFWFTFLIVCSSSQMFFFCIQVHNIWMHSFLYVVRWKVIKRNLIELICMLPCLSYMFIARYVGFASCGHHRRRTRRHCMRREIKNLCPTIK